MQNLLHLASHQLGSICKILHNLAKCHSESLNVSEFLSQSNNPYEVAYEPNKILCNRTTTRPGVYLGELPTTNARTVSGSFYVYDETTFFIQLFSLDTTKYEGKTCSCSLHIFYYMQSSGLLLRLCCCFSVQMSTYTISQLEWMCPMMEQGEEALMCHQRELIVLSDVKSLYKIRQSGYSFI